MKQIKKISVVMWLLSMLCVSTDAGLVELKALDEARGMDTCKCIKQGEPCEQSACWRIRCVLVFNDEGDECKKKDPSPGGGPLYKYSCASSNDPNKSCSEDLERGRPCEKYLIGVCRWGGQAGSVPLLLCSYINANVSHCGGAGSVFDGTNCPSGGS